RPARTRARDRRRAIGTRPRARAADRSTGSRAGGRRRARSPWAYVTICDAVGASRPQPSSTAKPASAPSSAKPRSPQSAQSEYISLRSLRGKQSTYYSLRSPRPLRFLLLTIVLCGLARGAAAHPVPFSYLDLRVERQAIEGTLVVHIFDAGH